MKAIVFLGLEMKFGAEKYICSVVLSAFCFVHHAHAFYGGLSPQNFNKMYYLATLGKVGILRDAVNRGLNIDSVNPNGDTGLCIAIKRNNYVAYNTFRMSGANPRHQCTYRIYKQYQEFLESNKAVHAEKIVGNEESLYYNDSESSWWPWILGGAAVGGGLWLWKGKSGGSSHKKSSSGGGGSDPIVIPTDPGYGLASYLTNYTTLVDNKAKQTNSLAINGKNPDAENVVDKIKFLPNMLDNYTYLKTFALVKGGSSFQNLEGGSIDLGDAAIAMSARDKNSKIVNKGTINMDARNGAIGLVASNGAQAFNGTEDSTTGDIRFIFKGSNEGDTVIGMYGDTHATISNYGNILGMTVGSEEAEEENSSSSSSSSSDDEEIIISKSNSGSIIGMSLFDFYTGTDLSSSTVTAKNYGNITLQAGNNNAENAAISLIGMGTYLDDNFLNGRNNPAFAEKMVLENYGVISLAYQKMYSVSDTALKLGDGGVIGMRADASTGALNQGTIAIDMRATTISKNNDVAAGMLSVHGAGLVNGRAGSNYDGTTENTGGTIRIVNEAKSEGHAYGMLAAKGSGTQTGLYKWQLPFLHNYGLIDMQVSNSYAMASVAGGEIVNDGMINLGVENGNSYYTNNVGLYAAGTTITEEVSLINNGIINVFAKESAAISNEFSGSVTQTNTGYIYLSNKATNSTAFGGKYSTAINTGSILYKVGNSEKFEFAEGSSDMPGFNIQTDLVGSVITASGRDDDGEDGISKQYAVNEETGVITVGGVLDANVDYGGTFGTAAMHVSQQGSARNKGLINLVSFNQDIMQFNSGMYLDKDATAEAYIENYGDIVVDATNSVGMRNDSENGASATNFGKITVNGQLSYGMSVNAIGTNLFNGRNQGEGDNGVIDVTGVGAVGMYIHDGNAWNYGSVYLRGNYSRAFLLDGEDSLIRNYGNIYHEDGLEEIVYYEMTNGASHTFQSPLYTETDEYGNEQTYAEVFDVSGYILGKATTWDSGGTAILSDTSAAAVHGKSSRLFMAEGKGSNVYNRGIVEVSDRAIGLVATDGGEAYNDMSRAKMTISHDKSIGIWGEDSGTSVGQLSGAQMYVTAGEGIHAVNFASAENGGTLTVSKGIGMYLSDGTSKSFTSGENIGTIKAIGTNAQGVVVENKAQFVNNGGTITAQSGAIGIKNSSGEAENSSKGVITAYANSIGVTGKITNISEIIAQGTNAIGVKGEVDNTGDIKVSSNATGVQGEAENSGTITVNSGIGVDGEAHNSGNIVVSSGIGVQGNITNIGTVKVYGGVGVKGSGTNSNTIETYGTAGVQVTGDFTNSGTITGNGIGAEVISGSFLNQGTITIGNGKAIQVDSGGHATSSGTITVGNGDGFYIKSGGGGLNSGTIRIEGSGWGANVESGGSFTNTGSIHYHSKKNGGCISGVGESGECIDEDAEKETTSNSGDSGSTSAVTHNVFLIEDGASFINSGLVDVDEENLDFDTGGRYVLADGGTYKAASFSGSVIADTDIVQKGFNDVYTAQGAFVGQNNGLNVTSKSYMFNADAVDNGDTTDITLTRKDFRDLVEEQDLAEFFELNYHARNNEKMYQALKSAQTMNNFNAQVESESGKKFYANLPRENMAVLRGLQNQEQKRILADGLDGVTVTADYMKTGKDGNGTLSDYDDNVYSVSIGGGKALNRNWSIGATLEAAYADSEYSDVHSTRENKILMALLPIMYQNNRFKFLTTPSIGVGYGSYTRKTLNNSYDADTFDIYYGLYNHAEYSIDMKIAELVTEAELNLQGVSSDDAKEKGGLKFKGDDSTSLEAGIGVKLRKRIQLAREKELMLAIGTKYYHELLDPYKDLTIGTSAAHYRLKGYDEDKNRLRTVAEAAYKDGHFTLSAEFAHNMEKEDNVEGGLGMRYNF